MNAMAVCMNLFGPWLLFSTLFATMSFGLHYLHPIWCWLIAGLLGTIVATFGFLAVQQRQKRKQGHDLEPSWMGFMFLVTAAAWIMAIALGDWNYKTNMEPYYDVGTLNSYPNVNPSHNVGQELMDAGRVVFREGSFLDIAHSFGYKNKDMFCVAPITWGNETLTSYDFWAIGLNCCTGSQADFHCGEYANPHAQAGLRLMADDQRGFFIGGPKSAV